ncbi:hypothetical protein F3Y22_tig00111273pilonHSYRG00145 [Hibiscus syriacus]|uniref:Uncharacterized protein n=1 Tax=Hibiscus syriacus TaxID=106335 RepID=A0A6A2YS38_HIBSY|nr:hypothetical protein F3Y22_tig00111273pilonHSYRG00145 [Hibiscus syriacus]
MAKTNSNLAAALLVVLLFAYGITFSQETRVLKADHQSVNNLNGDGSTRGGNVVNTAYSTDGFRPTTPGHSPGAGHSRGPTRNKHN